MKPKSPQPKRPRSAFKDPNADTNDLRNSRNHLLPYIQSPKTATPGTVVSHDESWVLIKDAYPKSSVHLLLLPRDPRFTTLHPYDALQDADFLAAARVEVAKAREIVAAELRRLHGAHSAADRPRRAAMAADDPPEELPPGRDWEAEVIAGVHTHPSMNHMHIHVLSVDRYSERLRHRKHYNSFNTEFFVPLEKFPMETEERERIWAMRWHEMDMMCWRCGRNFGNKFARLKEHLEEEFAAWRQE
ncbi:MAG: HIT domain-containing protein [Terriglobus roseus]|nr:HIT domain-containing protein [Terriglobus roseus]